MLQGTNSVYRFGEDEYEIEGAGQATANTARNLAAKSGTSAVLVGFTTPTRSKNNKHEIKDTNATFHPLNLRTDNKFHLQKPVAKK